jgi:predicted dehydrogenase
VSVALRFALVGAGRNAETYALAFERLAARGIARIAGIVDGRTGGAARDLADRLLCSRFSSYEEMSAAGCELDAVVLCTPPATHAEIAVHFLQRRIHVLCEQPLSSDAGSARRMAQEAASADALLAVASKFLFVGDVTDAGRLVASGVIGEIMQAESCFAWRVDMAARWRSDPALSGGGVLSDNGGHAVDLMRFFLGPLVGVQAVEGARRLGLDVEESVRLLVRNVQGAVGSIDLSWNVGKDAESYLTLYGTEGTLHLGWRESRYRPATSPGWTPFGTGYDKVRACQRQIENFARAIRGDEEPRTTMEDALASMAVIEAAYRALHVSRWTPVAAAASADSQKPHALTLLAGGRA